MCLFGAPYTHLRSSRHSYFLRMPFKFIYKGGNDSKNILLIFNASEKQKPIYKKVTSQNYIIFSILSHGYSCNLSVFTDTYIQICYAKFSNSDSEYFLKLLESYYNIYSDEQSSDRPEIFGFPMHAKYGQSSFPKYQQSSSIQLCLDNHLRFSISLRVCDNSPYQLSFFVSCRRNKLANLS